MTMRKVGVMQQFPSATKRRLEHERAEAQANAAGAELTEARLAVAREVAQAWIRRSTAEDSLAELRALEPELELQAAASRAGVAAGRSSTADALAAESGLAQLHNRLLRLQGEAKQATYELARWIDDDAGRPLAPAPHMQDLPTAPEVLQANIHQHGSLLPYESQIDAARLDVDLAKAQRRPDWSAEVAFAKRGPDFSDMVSLEFRIGLPLFTRNRQNPMIVARQAELRRLEAEREVELRMHTAELRQMIAEWQQLGEQLKQYDAELLPIARDRTRAALASYGAGRGEIRSALDAYAQEIDFLIERAQLRNEYGRAWAFLRYLGPEHLNHRGAP
jgi:outer membrane protein TolC